MLIGGQTFRLAPESGEKVSLSITVLLALTVYMMVVMDNVPENSQVVPLLRKRINSINNKLLHIMQYNDNMYFYYSQIDKLITLNNNTCR